MKSFIRDIALKLSPKISASVKRMRARHNSFSQFGEDIVLWNLLERKTKGVYLDCGAFDPFIFSNTALFYDAGWSGINIEPQRERWEIFESLRSRDVNLCEVISDSVADVEFFESEVPTLSGIGNSEGSIHRGVIRKRKPCSLKAVIDQYGQGKAIDFMSIDCEGHDLSVLRSNDWSKHRPLYVLVEDHEVGNLTDIDRFMNTNGYRFVIQLGPTKFFSA